MEALALAKWIDKHFPPSQWEASEPVNQGFSKRPPEAPGPLSGWRLSEEQKRRILSFFTI